jgi:putative ABC transport system permease protein
VAKLRHERGEAIPPRGSVLLERSSVDEYDGDLGDAFELKVPHAKPHRVTVAGFVHEPALAPAKSEQAIYTYVSEETARDLGVTDFDELRILLREHQDDRALIEQSAEELATWITTQGLAKVRSIRVPPPLRHPHQTQMTAVLALFATFSGVILAMSSFLAATLMNTLMARQVREIGAMKAMGARTVNLISLYALMIFGLSAVALAFAWLPGDGVTHTLTKSVTTLLNFDVRDASLPHWVVVVDISIGLLLPLLMTIPRIISACRVTVREALFDRGLAGDPTGTGRFETLLSKLKKLPAVMAYSLRGVVRRKRQFALSLGLFMVAGGGFIGAMSIAKAWDVLLGQIDRTRHYDVEVHLTDLQDAERAKQRVSQLNDVRATEIWQTVPVALARPGRPAIERTYPDNAHGVFHLIAPPHEGKLLGVECVEGRWLLDTDTDGVVINQLVPGYADLAIGDVLTVAVAGEARRLTVVGKAIQIGVGATAYVSAATFTRLVPEARAEGQLWVAAASHATGEPSDLISHLEHGLDAADIDVKAIVPVSIVKNAMAAHFEILVKTLLLLAGLLSMIGALGLASALGVSVSERTRELGVLRAIGASARQVRDSVLFEGLGVGVASIAGAIVVGLGLALLVGDVVGEISFKVPLPLTPSLPSLALWVCGAPLFAALGSLGPARQAARIKVRDALVWLAILLAFAGTLSLSSPVVAEANKGVLTVQVNGFEDDRGQVVVKLFRREDNAPRGAGFRRINAAIQQRHASVSFADLGWGTYAVLVFHDQNANGTLDHNLLGLPSEPMGFSTGFRPSIWTGVPDFDDFKFDFGPGSNAIQIKVE